MSKSDSKIKQLGTGIHLAEINNAWATKDHTGKPVITNANEMPITVQFIDGKGLLFEQGFFLQRELNETNKISSQSTKAFRKMCDSFGINPANPNFKDECGLTNGTKNPRRRGYIFIKEVYDVNQEVMMKDEFTGEDIVNHYIFDFEPFRDGMDAPKKKGCPMDGKQASGDFLSYRQIDPIEVQLDKQKRIAKGKEIIKAVEKKSEWDLDENIVKPLPVDKEFEERYGANMKDVEKEIAESKNISPDELGLPEVYINTNTEAMGIGETSTIKPNEEFWNITESKMQSTQEGHTRDKNGFEFINGKPIKTAPPTEELFSEEEELFEEPVKEEVNNQPSATTDDDEWGI